MIDVKTLTPSELAAALVVPRISAESYFSDENPKEEARKLVEMGIGGFCVFRGKRSDTFEMIDELQNLAKRPLVFSADFEHGLPMRLEGGTEFPHSAALGRLRDKNLIEECAFAIAQESRSIGVDWPLSPVCDVNSNPDNPVIGVRSFGETLDPVNVSVEKHIAGFKKAGAASCAKHFPGHGDASADSHLVLPTIVKSLEDLENFEFEPFRKTISVGVESIMLAHLRVSALSDRTTSLSPETVDYLRNRMKFAGLIVTDALDMKAISKEYSSGESAYSAIAAGANVALMPENPFEAIEFLTIKIEEDKNFRSQCVESAERFYRFKNRFGSWNKNERLDQQSKISFEKHEKLALRAAYQALEIDDPKGLIPLSQNERFAGFAILGKGDLDESARFFRMLSQAVKSECDFAFIDENITEDQLKKFADSISEAQKAVFAYFFKQSELESDALAAENLRKLIDKILRGKPKIDVFFADPFYARKIESEAKITTFSKSLPSLAAAILQLSGMRPTV